MLLRVEFTKRVASFFVLFLLLCPRAFATWSVLAVSQISGRVVIASATCLALEPPQTLMKIQAVVVPGKGVAAAQALLDPAFASKRNNKWGLYVKTADGAAKEELIIESEQPKRVLTTFPPAVVV